MKVLSGTSNLKLSKEVAKLLKVKLVNTKIIRFADGEVYVEINENIRGNSIFVVLNDKKYLFNIRSYVNAKLIRLGINNIDHIEMDTFSNNENFFSYRRSKKNDDKDYGRCISVIIMT